VIDRAEERCAAAGKGVNRKSAVRKLRLPGKLADCSQKARTGGTVHRRGRLGRRLAKQARDRKNQAILPLRGKILNVWASGLLDKLMANQEISDLFQALAAARGEIPRSRTCATSGHHHDRRRRGRRAYRSLLITFFYRMMPDH
jgi:topoisomerase-4 subunit B